MAIHSFLTLVILATGLYGCSTAPRVLEPPCPTPAPLEGEWDRRAPGYMVILRSEPNPLALAQAFVEKHGLVTGSISRHVFTIKEISPEALAALRCETFVKLVLRNKQLGNVIQSAA